MPKKTKRDPKADILAAYARVARSLRVHPTTGAMVAEGVSRNMIRHHFGNVTKLHEEFVKAHTDVAEMLNDVDLYSPQRRKALRDDIRSCRRFLVTTAVTTARVHAGFLAAMRRWCKENDGRILVLAASDPASLRERPVLPPELESELIVTEDTQLNRNLHISSIKLSAKHIDPVTGLDRLGQRDGSFIYASPKQRLKYVANSSTSLPCALMTTGACTLPDYDPSLVRHAYMSKRTAYIAEHDHVVGAIVVELDGDSFHFRQVQADKQGRFADLGRLYAGDKIIEYAPEAMVLGDLHDGETDEQAMEAAVYGKNSLARVTNARVCILHDAFNGLSINPHEQGNATLRAREAAAGQLSLSDEIQHLAATLRRLLAVFEEIVIVKSNHDEFLDRYLANSTYRSDPLNTAAALRMHAIAIDGGDPLAVTVGSHLTEEERERIRFLARDEDYKIGGVECSAHGDKGANGSRGTVRAMENAFGASVSGHSHTPEILRMARRVGTHSKLKLSYNSGPSSWMHTDALVYKSGAVQLINFIGGRFRAD